MDLISKYLNYTRDYESPTSFFKWSCYSAIAGILRDNVYRVQMDSRIYPNVYVLLLADSGVHRKGTPTKLVESFVKQVGNTKVVCGRTSIQAVLDDLAEKRTTPDTGTVLSGGSAFFSAPELSASIVEDPQAVRILTDIYDFHKDYTVNLKGSGRKHISNICFTMCAASNEELLKAVYGTGAIHGGLLARTFIVKPDEFRKGNSFFDFNPLLYDKEGLIKCFKDLATLRGEFHVDQDAKDEYNNWYYPLREGLKKRKDPSGVLNRIHTGVLKLSMILAIGHREELVVRKKDIEESIADCVSLLGNYEDFIMQGGSGKTDNAQIGSTLLREMYEGGGFITKKQFLNSHWGEISTEDFDKLVNTLVNADHIANTVYGAEIAYVFTESCRKKYEARLGAIVKQ